MDVNSANADFRSCTPQALAFAKAILSNSSGKADKYAALTQALKGHSEYAKRTTQGRGIDRHLLGLGLVAAEAGLPAPEILSDPSWTRSTRHRISSSQVSGPALVCGFAPLVPDGYGTCYNIRDHQINVACTAHRACADTSAARFREELERSMLDMHDCLLSGENLNAKL